MTIRLDRMVLEDVGANPRRLAEAIHEQLGRCSGPVPVHDIAQALDIVEIREAPLSSFEAALLTTPERRNGSILINADSSSQRKRFSLSHELGHFLNPWHKPTLGAGFRCRRADMTVSDQRNEDRHRRQEAEANCFSIELLTPRSRLRPYLATKPALRHILKMAADLDISREAAGRRYVELHDDNLAIVFGKGGRFLYATRSVDFPTLGLRKDQPITAFENTQEGVLSDVEEADAADWLYQPGRHDLTCQFLRQRNGFSMTLLHAPTANVDDDISIEDAYERFAGRHQDTRR